MLKEMNLCITGNIKATGEIMDTCLGFAEKVWMNPAVCLPKTWATYMELAFFHKKPFGWTTPNKIILKGQKMNLRYFLNPNLCTNDHLPVLVLTPNANHNGKLADYAENQSLVKTLHKQGLNAYVLEWLSTDAEDADLGIDDYIRFTNKAAELIKAREKMSQVHLVGQCQGGWQAAMYASLYPDNVCSLTIAGSPIDLSAEYGFMNMYFENMDMSIYESFTKLGYLPGDTMLKLFKAMEPHKHYALKYLDMFGMALDDDQKAIDRQNRFTVWYENPQNIPRRYYLEVVQHIFKENCLTHPGSFAIDGASVDLRNITCPVIAIGGLRDHITPIGQCHAIKDLVSTPQENIHLYTQDAGHIGVLMGSKVLRDLYPEICDIMKNSETGI
jgi:poly(3-hydroxyalkanoate) synthetase